MWWLLLILGVLALIGAYIVMSFLADDSEYWGD